jgi:DNA-binding FrmR family transcriptional regulator
MECGPQASTRAGTADEAASLLNRLKRLEGQIRGIQRMLDEGRVCEDVLTQVMAVRSGVDQVGLLMLDHHLNRCVLSEATVDEAKLQEMRNALRMWLRFAPISES